MATTKTKRRRTEPIPGVTHTTTSINFEVPVLNDARRLAAEDGFHHSFSSWLMRELKALIKARTKAA